MEWTLRVASWLSLVLVTLLKPYFWLRNCSRPPKIPSANNPLLNISAVQLAKKIRHGEISSEYVVEAYIKRIKEVNPCISAVVDNRFEAALEDARLCDKMLSIGEVTIAQLADQMPFFGVPVTVKESCGLKGLSYTGCTKIRAGFKAEEDSSIVQGMKAAGAIPLCVTNTSEICSSFETTNLVYGTTCNAYDGRHSAGGSSGGEGSLIGAGASLIGIGSDIAGSIRLPAMFNGIFGHKPTPGLIPIEGHFPMGDSDEFRKYLVLGPLTRYAEDLHATIKVMSAGCKQNLRLDEPVDVTKLKIFYMENVENNYGIQPINYDIQEAVCRAAAHFERHGAEVNKAVIPKIVDSAEMGAFMLLDMPNLPHILIHPHDKRIKVNGFREFMKSMIGCSVYSKPAIFMALIEQVNAFTPRSRVPKYYEKLRVLESQLLKMLGDDGVLFCPTFPIAAPLIGQVIFQPTSGMLCLLCNVLGLPATEVPMGLNRHGLPIGFQVVAAPNNDRLCLAVAMELEKAFGGWIPPTTESL